MSKIISFKCRGLFYSNAENYFIQITRIILFKEYEYEHISSNNRTLLFEYKHIPLRIAAHPRTFFLSGE